MKTLKDFRRYLEDDGVKILKEDIDEAINIVTISKIPLNARYSKSNRRDIYNYNDFILKSCDKDKFNTGYTEFEELKKEILAAKKFADKIDILQKIAILRLIEGTKNLLVEERLKPFEEFPLDLINRAKEKEEEAKKIFNQSSSGIYGDFKKENLVYCKDCDKLLFTDVFPQEKHLINN